MLLALRACRKRSAARSARKSSNEDASSSIEQVESRGALVKQKKSTGNNPLVLTNPFDLPMRSKSDSRRPDTCGVVRTRPPPTESKLLSGTSLHHRSPEHSVSPKKHRLLFRGRAFLHTSSFGNEVLPPRIPRGISFVAHHASFQELFDRKILNMRPEDMVHLTCADVHEIYEAKCIDQQLVTSWEREARFMEIISVHCGGIKFSLQETGLGSESALAISRVLASNQHYAVLDLSGNRIGDLGAEAIASLLTENRHLAQICLRSNDIGPVGGEHLARVLNNDVNNTVVVLDLSSNISGVNRNHIGAYGASMLAEALKCNDTLYELNLASNGLGNEGISKLAPGLQYNVALRELNLVDNIISADGAVILFESLMTSNIQSLYLDNNSIGDRGISAFANLYHSSGINNNCDNSFTTAIEHLSIANTGIRSAGIIALTNAIRTASIVHLRVLVLSGNSCGGSLEANLSIAQTLRENRSIREYHFNGCDLTSSIGTELGLAVANNPVLEVLDLANNVELGNGGVIPLLNALQRHKTIRYLDLSNVGASDETGYAIARLLTTNTFQFEELYVRQNNLNVSGEMIAESLRDNPRIRALDLSHNSLSYAAHSAVETLLKQNRKLWNAHTLPSLSVEIQNLRSSERELQRIEEEMVAERRITKEKIDESFRRKEIAKNNIEHLRIRNAELIEQLERLKETLQDVENQDYELSEHVQREKSRMDGRTTSLDMKRKSEEDRKNEFLRKKDRIEKKIKESADSDLALELAESELRVRALEETAARCKSDAMMAAEKLVTAELQLMEMYFATKSSVKSVSKVNEAPSAIARAHPYADPWGAF